MFYRPLAVALATLALVFAAVATPAMAATPEAEADYALALQAWAIPAPPMCASVTIESATEAPDPTTLDDPAGSTPYASASIPTAHYWPCVITIYEGSWATLTPCLRRAVMRHEVGHLQGLGHSTDPTSIMYPEVQAAVWCPGEAIPAVEVVPAPTEPPVAAPAPPHAAPKAPLHPCRHLLGHRRRRCLRHHR